MDPFWEDAITRGDVDAVREMLRRGADVNARNRYGQTGLMLAAHAGHREVVEVLVRHGADLDVTAKFGLSALMLAVVSGHSEIARLLARAGSDLSLRGSGAPGFSGKTARDLALARGMHSLATELEPAQ
jgi:ankyrin repeat protein